MVDLGVYLLLQIVLINMQWLYQLEIKQQNNCRSISQQVHSLFGPQQQILTVECFLSLYVLHRII